VGLTSSFLLASQVLGPELSRGKPPKRNGELSKADLVLLSGQLVSRMSRVLSTSSEGAETRLNPSPSPYPFSFHRHAHVRLFPSPAVFFRVFDGEITQDNAINAIPIAFLNKFFCKSSKPWIFRRVVRPTSRPSSMSVVLATGGLPEINLGNVSLVCLPRSGLDLRSGGRAFETTLYHLPAPTAPYTTVHPPRTDP